MKRLRSTVITDFRLQFRNGFYYASAFVALVYIVLVNQLPEQSLGLSMPMLIAANALINAFYFMAGLVLLEKGEGSLEAQVVTPLRTGEYLASKAITLTALTLVENMLIVALTVGLSVNWLLLIAGIGVMAPFMVLVGFIAVSRYDSINEFMFPSVIYVAVLSLPFLPYVGILDGAWVYLMPLQAGLVLLQAAFQPVETWKIVYGLLVGSFWVAATFVYARQMFHRFVVLKAGADGR